MKLCASKNNMSSLVRNIGTTEAIFKRQELESLLKKCPNVTKVLIHLRNICNNELLLFGQYSPPIKSLDFDIRGEEDMDFGRQYGHKLEELEICGTISEKKQFLEFCPNLKKLIFSKHSILFTDALSKEFMPKLEYFGKLFSENFNDIKEFKIFVDKYSQTMKILNITLNNMNAEDMKTCIEFKSRFGNLRELNLEIMPSVKIQPIDDCLSLIGQKCNKLLKLDLSIDHWVPISEQFSPHFPNSKPLRN